jgi:hypothetical protein
MREFSTHVLESLPKAGELAVVFLQHRFRSLISWDFTYAVIFFPLHNFVFITMSRPSMPTLMLPFSQTARGLTAER